VIHLTRPATWDFPLPFGHFPLVCCPQTTRIKHLCAAMAENRNLAPTWVTMAGFGFLTLNSGLAIYSARGDPASVLFVVGSYLALLLLFRCLRAYERAPPGSPEKGRARRAVWPLTTLLTAAFSSP
ncbi:hypothetical protein SETIT_3G360100v2, partial [Setaria italica]